MDRPSSRPEAIGESLKHCLQPPQLLYVEDSYRVAIPAYSEYPADEIYYDEYELVCIDGKWRLSYELMVVVSRLTGIPIGELSRIKEDGYYELLEGINGVIKADWDSIKEDRDDKPN